MQPRRWSGSSPGRWQLGGHLALELLAQSDLQPKMRPLAICQRRCKADMASLLERYTYGLPPPQYRGQVAAVAEDPLPSLMRARERMALEVYVGDGGGTVMAGADITGKATVGLQPTGRENSEEGAAAELLALSEEVEDEVAAALDPAQELPLSVSLPQHLLPPSSRSRKSMARSAEAGPDERQEDSSVGALLGECPVAFFPCILPEGAIAMCTPARPSTALARY